MKNSQMIKRLPPKSEEYLKKAFSLINSNNALRTHELQAIELFTKSIKLALKVAPSTSVSSWDYEYKLLISRIFYIRGSIFYNVELYHEAIIDFIACLEMIILKSDSKPWFLKFTQICQPTYVDIRLKLAKTYEKMKNYSSSIFNIYRRFNVVGRNRTGEMAKYYHELNIKSRDEKCNLMNKNDVGGMNNFYKFFVKCKWDVVKLNNLVKNWRRVYCGFEKVGDFVILFGGNRSQRDVYFNDMIMINLNNSNVNLVKCKGEIPTKRSCHSMVQWRDNLYLYGGENIYLKKELFYEYTVKDKRWKVLKVPGTSYIRDSHSAVVFEDKMFIYGGKSCMNDLENGNIDCYDFQNKKWSRVFTYDPKCVIWNQPQPRYFHWCFVKDLKMYVFGGIMRKTSQYYTGIEIDPKESEHEGFSYKDLWYWDLKEKNWNRVLQTGNAPSPRSEGLSSCVILDDKVYIYGGYVIDDVSGSTPNSYISFSYKRELFQLSFIDKLKGNEIIGKRKIFNKFAHWRLILLNQNNSLPSTADNILFKHKEEIYIIPGYGYKNSNDQNKTVRIFSKLIKLELPSHKFKRECLSCLKPGSTKRCQNCKQNYCSRECQKRDWKWHKNACKNI